MFSDSSQNQNQTQSSAANPHFDDTAVLTFTNPAVTTPSFELQPNRAYNANSLPPAPQDSEWSSTADGGVSGSEHSPSVRIADNPRYGQFSSQQHPSGSRVGVVSTESDYDYPTTFQGAPLIPRDTDSDSRTTDNPLYATIQ